MEKISPLQRLWNLIRLEKSEVASIYFYAGLSGLIQLSLPVGIQAIIGFVLGAAMVTSIYVLIFLVVAGVAAVGLLQINQMKVIERIQQKIFTRNAFEFADIIPRFDLVKTDSYYLPEKVNRFFDTLNVQKGLSKLLLDVPIATIQIVLGLLLLGLYHPFFIVFGIVLLLILWLIFTFTGKSGLDSSLRESVFKYKVAGWLQDMARVINTFKIAHGNHLNLQKTDTFVSGYLDSRSSHFKVLLFQYKTLVFVKVAITTAMLTVGTYLLLNQQLNIGEFIAAEIVILTVINAVEKLIVNLDSAYDVVTGLEKLATVTENMTERDGKFKLANPEKGIDLELIDFSFAFPGGKIILENTSLHIPSGSRVCIRAQRGSGKSTLLKILGGFYHEYSGSILVNNIPLTSYESQSLRENFGVFFSQKEVFNGSILENITMDRKGITPETINQLAEKTGLLHDLKMPVHGLETSITSNGKNVRGTVLRSIMLLRALLNEPSLLLLEEPWAGFEEPVKEKIISYLINRPPHVTVIVVTQDEAFASRCDYIISLNSGFATIQKNN
ncbi:ATP-binding cassette domain-containing protein [Dyadobacter diqingensis]|uniref:ATP-binding cassette domain-containing protein n=1 Tax=Dyadobacter diqingensis TaxID=2938121 RepID=UPI0020C1A6DE|nr:ATP-binding cassette domain-containing protein [Dyadobacter diqingensis]